ncbi:RHS repeat-associated core domain-containing protein, partial [Edaphovirga cremea]|uniref:RHS repeat-associated core domain-containing protein n=1 Tax=Edaphovirga cremea TaxID=2267246 RepID=UPI00398A3F83
DILSCNLRFAGQYADDESGLHYNRFRYYDNETGQYLTPDPIGLAGGVNPYGYVHNPVGYIDPLGLACICPGAAGQLPKLKGKSINQIEKMLSQQGFTQTKVSNSAAKNQVWSHADGSEVRIHPYGNQSMNMNNGQLTPKSGLNAHIHKQNPSGDQLTDLGHVSTNPDLTHIGIRNPVDYPTVRGRPHGSGR